MNPVLFFFFVGVCLFIFVLSIIISPALRILSATIIWSSYGNKTSLPQMVIVLYFKWRWAQCVHPEPHIFSLDVRFFFTYVCNIIYVLCIEFNHSTKKIYIFFPFEREKNEVRMLHDKGKSFFSIFFFFLIESRMKSDTMFGRVFKGRNTYHFFFTLEKNEIDTEWNGYWKQRRIRY